MKGGTERSPKSLNMKWLVALATFDLIIVVFFVVPELVNGAAATKLGIARGIATVALPVIILLIINVLPANVKAMLVYWKPLNSLPGSEAFTKYAPADPRIDMVSLKRNVGALPTDPREQNAKWYKLYKKVETHMEVASAQKDFLMYRDMAVLSLFLLLLVPLGLYLNGVGIGPLLVSGGLFFVQYILTAISARHAGVRFVCNVLALHSAKRITG